MDEMTEEEVRGEVVKILEDDLERRGLTGKDVELNDIRVIGEDGDDIFIEIDWATKHAGPGIIYEGGASNRKIGGAEVCIDCGFSMPCLGGTDMKFMRSTGGQLKGKAFARLDVERSAMSPLEASMRRIINPKKDIPEIVKPAWREVSDVCPGVPWHEDGVLGDEITDKLGKNDGERKLIIREGDKRR